MPTETIIEDEDQVEEQKKSSVAKKRKQIFQRAIKRDYQRHDIIQKTR